MESERGREGEVNHMKRNRKCNGRTGIALLALCAGFVLAPGSWAQAPAATSTTQSQTQANPGTQTAPDTQQRLENLQKEVDLLQSEIASLKQEDDSTAATVKTAALNTSSASGKSRGDAPAPVSLTSLLGPMTISGEVDGYYSFNFNQPNPLGNQNTPPSGTTGNALRFFDNNTNQFSLNAIELVVDRAPDATVGGTGRAGFHVGVIYGQAAEVINGTSENNGDNFVGNATDANNAALKEAYVDYIAPVGKGLTITLGKFVTPAGAEVIESNGNWNYSRSILFYYAIPFFHFGASAKYAFNSKWAVTGYLVNGWNNSQAVNTGKTYGASLAYTPNAKWSVIETYMAGPQDNAFFNGTTGGSRGPNNNWRQLEDAVISYTPNAKWAFMVNGDYAYGDKFGISPGVNSPPVSWWGAAGYVKYTLSSKAYVAARGEYFADPNGFALFGVGNNNGHVYEGTGTFAYNWTRDLQTRFEFRDDVSNRNIFAKGTRFVMTQPIAELGFIYSFSSANAH